jgi:hypothetical protein
MISAISSLAALRKQWSFFDALTKSTRTEESHDAR